MENTGKYAVITGDIIQSRKIGRLGSACSVDNKSENKPSALDVLRELDSYLSNAIKDFRAHFDVFCEIDDPVDVFRGDSWQVVLPRPEFALRLTLFFFAALKQYGIKTRASIGIGSASYIDYKNISHSTGEAFYLSGLGLDEMSVNRSSIITLNTAAKSDSYRSYVYEMIGEFASTWTPAVAASVYYALLGMNTVEISKEKRTTHQNISYLLRKSEWRLISKIIESEELVNNAGE